MEKTIVKIAVITIALVLSGIIFFFVNSIFGNPISAAIATSQIQKYVQQNYPGQDLEIPRAQYNFKNSSYVAVIKSRTSRDTYFAVSWSSDSIRDSYESEVAGRFTTFRRLQSEFDAIIEDIIAAEYPYPTSLVLGDLAKSDGDFSALELDMSLDVHNPPLETSLVIWTSSEELSYQIIAERLLELHRLMQKRNIPIDTYSLRLTKEVGEDEKPSEDLYAYDFPAEKIVEAGLAAVLQEHQEELDRHYNQKR